ncbi:hypothetical protein GCM10023257_60390 [Streptomyces hyderabadensis]|uniref:Uncharacterized protein n=1 Tax=Streptomyces hyderabadensis TaxID=598549 RepID=A0ABP9IQU6_9ACTN
MREPRGYLVRVTTRLAVDRLRQTLQEIGGGGDPRRQEAGGGGAVRAVRRPAVLRGLRRPGLPAHQVRRARARAEQRHQ